MKSRKIPAQDPSRWNKATMIHIQQLLLSYHLPARGIFQTSLEGQCWCMYQYWDYMHTALPEYHPWNSFPELLAVTGKLHNRWKLSATQTPFFPCSMFGSSKFNVKCTFTGLMSRYFAPTGHFCLKIKNWKKEKTLVFVGFMILWFYILFLHKQNLAVYLFLVPSQLRRGMGNTSIHTKKKRTGKKESRESSSQRIETG